jgi:hypothetical protein
MKTLKIIILSILVFTAFGCRKNDLPKPLAIDLGKKSISTSIKTIIVKDNIVNVIFETTVGAKYSVQIVPFGSEEPIKKEGFTANDNTTAKSYDLSDLPKKNYDLIFIDISGNEAKYPITIK